MQKKENTSLFQWIYHVNSEFSTKFDLKTGISLKISGVTGIFIFLLGMGKLGLGIYSQSFFSCVSAFYTFGMVIARYFALKGIVKANSLREQYRYYFLSGIILVISNLIFIVYSIRLFFYPITDTYHMYAALSIAAFTFTELILNIRGAIVERKSRAPLFHAIKMINLASALICLVLTQSAILSFADTKIDLHPTANGFTGILMGSTAALLGIIMILRIRKFEGIRSEKRNGGTI